MQLLTLDQKQNKRTDVTKISSSLIVRCITAYVPLSLCCFLSLHLFLFVSALALPLFILSLFSSKFHRQPRPHIPPYRSSPRRPREVRGAGGSVAKGPRAVPPAAAPVPAPTSCTHERPLVTSDEMQSPQSAREKNTARANKRRVDHHISVHVNDERRDV